MRLEYFAQARFVVIMHLIIAIFATMLGLWQWLAKKGTISHKFIGRIWCFLMLGICFSSFEIRTIMPDSPFFGFSLIHILSVWTIFSIIYGIYSIRQGNIARHARIMRYSYGGLIVAGIFTFFLDDYYLEYFLYNEALLHIITLLDCHTSFAMTGVKIYTFYRHLRGASLQSNP